MLIVYYTRRGWGCGSASVFVLIHSQAKRVRYSENRSLARISHQADWSVEIMSTHSNELYEFLVRRVIDTLSYSVFPNPGEKSGLGTSPRASPAVSAKSARSQAAKIYF